MTSIGTVGTKLAKLGD